MATHMISLAVIPRGKPIKQLTEEITLPRVAPASQIYQTIAAKTGTSIHRIRITKGSDGQLVPNDKDVLVQQAGLLDGSKIYVKDLGPQISWQTVFMVEYVGPLIIHPLVYLLRPYIYSNPNPLSAFPESSSLQQLSLILICLHYAKRELETVFIHRFSTATMPATNIFKNSFHYWVISGVFLAYFIYGPNSATAGEIVPSVTYSGIIFYVAGQLGNLSSHLTLRGLRSCGGKERGIPRGWAFNLVTCPNYMFEALSWIGVLLVTRSWAAGVFLVAALVPMGLWAKKKERRYRREFGDKYKNKRSVMLPGVF